MKLHKLLDRGDLVIIKKCRTKEQTIRMLLQKLWENSGIGNEGIPFETILKELLHREKEQTTAIGAGFAFPHARLNNFQGSYFQIAVCRNGLDFDSLDEQPVFIIIMSLVPRLKPGLLIKFRAALISVLMKPELKEHLLRAETAGELYELIKKEDKELDQEITAADIMNPVVYSITPEMTLYEAARELHRHHVDSLPVIDKNSRLLGKLSCHDLFSYQLPDFFNTLHSISFIKYMNPFEKYFEIDQKIQVGQLKFKQKAPVIRPDATLMEMVFEMTVRDQELLYVVENEKLLGSIDRYNIIDKILISGLDGDSI